MKILSIDTCTEIISISLIAGEVVTEKFFPSGKDYSGNILPGHGGILDRLDSYLPTISILHIWLFL